MMKRGRPRPILALLLLIVGFAGVVLVPDIGLGFVGLEDLKWGVLIVCVVSAMGEFLGLQTLAQLLIVALLGLYAYSVLESWRIA